MASADSEWEEEPAGIKWTPLKMMHMEYPEGDKVGHVLAWFSMSPFFIFAGMVTLILFRRDIHTIVFTLGQLVNEVFNLILKRIIKGASKLQFSMRIKDFLATYLQPLIHTQPRNPTMLTLNYAYSPRAPP